MAYRTILVVFRRTEQAETLAKMASILAVAHGAHVIGLYAVPQAELYPAIGFPVAIDVADVQRKLQDSDAEAIKTAFQSHGKNLGTSWEWRYVRSEGAPVSRIVQTHARTSDLVVISPPSSKASFLEPDLTFESLLIGSGRPMLIVPDACGAALPGKKAMVAWNGTKEAARAAFDAVPMISAAKPDRASVVWLDPPAGEAGAHEASSAELSTSLARHGINVTAMSVPITHGSVGEELLALCKAHGADLLVMGGYGHSRIREFVLGGATDHLLRNAHLPVLMSH